MVSETDALLRLSRWFKENGWTILQDKKNKLDNPRFHVKGESREKPDLIVNNNVINIAIEVKSGENSRDLGAYSKNLIYFKNYNDDKTFYFDNLNRLICIDFFVIGSYYSLEGHLKAIEEKHIDGENSTRLKSALEYGSCPISEYETTFTLTRRGIWDHLAEHYNKYRKYSTGIGTLLSTCLDNDGCRPAIHVMVPKQSYGKTQRHWRQQWIKP